MLDSLQLTVLIFYLVTSMAAMKRAAAMARKAAVQTDTAIVVVHGEKIVRVTADDLRKEAGS